MSFTTDVKREMLSRMKREKNGAVYAAAFSAFVRTSGTLGVSDGKPSFFIVSETETVAEFFTGVFEKLFQAELAISRAVMDKKSGRDKLVFLCPSHLAGTSMKALGLLKKGSMQIRDGILPSLVKDDDKKIAYIRGAFLGGGSCLLPSETTGYHLEIVFFDKTTAKDFCIMLDEFEIIARMVERKETFVVYIKSKEAISDFLALVGAENALHKFSVLVEKRDEANNDNRARNCISGNADKAAIAAVKQVVAIRKLHENADFNQISEELKTLARTRLQYPSKTLKELAEHLGVSKSCLNHRMRKLLELAEEIKEGGENE